MNQSKKTIIQTQIAKTIENLTKNNMPAFYAEDEAALIEKIKELVPEGASISCGGSMTLFETGVIEHLRCGRYKLLDRYAPGLTPEQTREVFVSALSADTYICGTNAVTMNGELYNVDGNGNRVAALLFGPKSVIMVVGQNKLVRDLNDAAARVRNLAAPTNAERLNRDTPCRKTGCCVNCAVKERICADYVTMARQTTPGRVKVIIVGKELGY